MKAILKFLRSFFGMDSLFDRLVAYLCGGETLPKPLAPEEEARLIGLKLSGDEAAKNALVEHNLRLVIFLARKFDNTNTEMDDLISVGTIGLIKAVNSFEPEKNIKLATYASRCIENEILMYLRKMSRRRAEISLDEPLNVDGDGNELLLSDILGTDADSVSGSLDAGCDIEVLYECMRFLSDRERNIVNLRFGLFGNTIYTQKEVADIMGISQSYISRLEKKIFLKLKKDIQKKLIT